MPLDPTAAKQHVGVLTEEIVAQLSLSLNPGPIYMGRGNFKHISRRHPEMYQAYLDDIPLVLANPDYIGVNPKQGGVEFIKKLAGNHLVAVRASARGTLYARSIYDVGETRLLKTLAEGNLVRYQEGAVSIEVEAAP